MFNWWIKTPATLQEICIPNQAEMREMDKFPVPQVNHHPEQVNKQRTQVTYELKQVTAR